jgi:hypothetical protein
LHPYLGQVSAGTFVAIQFAGNNHLRRKTMLGTILIFVIASLFCCRVLDCPPGPKAAKGAWLIGGSD